METATVIQECDSVCERTVIDTLGLIGSKWSIPILARLIDTTAPARYSTLRRAIDGITAKELAKHLRRLQSASLIVRTVIDTSPPTVEYALTARGRRLVQALTNLSAWNA